MKSVLSLQETCINKIVKKNLDYKILPKILKETIQNIQDQHNWKIMWDKFMLLYRELFDKSRYYRICRDCNNNINPQLHCCRLCCYNCHYNNFFESIKNFHNINLKEFFICSWCKTKLNNSTPVKNIAIAINLFSSETMCVDCLISHILESGYHFFIDNNTSIYDFLVGDFLPISPEILKFYYPDLMKYYHDNGYKFIKVS
jgi:hypothetical protein